MSEIAVVPIVLKDCIVSIAADDYAAAVNSVVITPTAASVIFKGLKPSAVYTDIAAATWVLALGFAQDWATPESLSRYLHAHEGDTVDAIIKPQSGVGPAFAVTIIITPGSIGGAEGAVAVSSVNLGVQGRPELVETAALPVVSGADDATGPTAGGDLVTVFGSGFLNTSAVHFGAVPASEFEVENDGELRVVSPAASAGSQPIKVTNPTGQSVTSAPYVYS